MLCLAWTWRAENRVPGQGGLLNSIPVKGQRNTVPSEFTGFLPEIPSPSVTSPLPCTLCRLHTLGTACHSHVLSSGEEPCPTYMLFLYCVSSGYVSD